MPHTPEYYIDETQRTPRSVPICSCHTGSDILIETNDYQLAERLVRMLNAEYDATSK